MKYLARTPILPWRHADNRLLATEELLDQAAANGLRDKIALVSSHLSEALSQPETTAKAKEKFTLYAFRASQRCVPFGPFVSIGVVNGAASASHLPRPGPHRKTGRELDQERRQGIASMQVLSNRAFVNGTLTIRSGAYQYIDCQTGVPNIKSGTDWIEVVDFVLRRKSSTLTEIQQNFPTFGPSHFIATIDRGIFRLIN